jgi:hypothetical protein
VRPLDWRQRLAAVLPHPLPLSNNKLLLLEKALPSCRGCCVIRFRNQRHGVLLHIVSLPGCFPVFHGLLFAIASDNQIKSLISRQAAST